MQIHLLFHECAVSLGVAAVEAAKALKENSVKYFLWAHEKITKSPFPFSTFQRRSHTSGFGIS